MSATRGPRAPLASIPNAANSPHRSALSNSNKRPRPANTNTYQENEPPQKKIAIEKDKSQPTTPKRRLPPSTAEGRVFERGTTTGQPTAFQKKLVAARDQPVAFKVTKNNDRKHDNAESVRQWQAHYRKIFPTFSFYFDAVPDEVRLKFTRQIAQLGAREERFFSKNVTHIITTRAVPPENEQTSDTNSVTSTMSTEQTSADSQPQTINPSLLNKGPGSRSQTSETTKSNPTVRDGASNDVLSRGRQMGMKLWAAEKLQRILISILDDYSGHTHNTRSSTSTARPSRHEKEDLSQVLRNERVNGHVERDVGLTSKDFAMFKGPFIYVHDMDEKTRPIMVREYPKASQKGDGAWPQFRSASSGKCPFVEDLTIKKELEREKALLLQQGQETQAKARPANAVDAVKMEPPRRKSPRRALQEVKNVPAPPKEINFAPPEVRSLDPPKIERNSSYPPPSFIRPSQMHFAVEPAASGIQRSNLTSAIQSNMISSTAAAPGAKAGTSREVHDLQRKVLERTNTGSLSLGSIPSSHRMNDIAGSLRQARGPAPQRAAKSRAQEKLGGVPEEGNSDEEQAVKCLAVAPKKQKVIRKEAKPGYCENCRDKYEDFEEVRCLHFFHIIKLTSFSISLPESTANSH